MEDFKYIPRLIEHEIEKYIHSTGCVVIEGPKWCGKSTTAERFAKTIRKLQDPVIFRQFELYSRIERGLLLSGEKPILFDEWQKIPDLWDIIRLTIDEAHGKCGQFILTGSTKPQDDINRHSGVGRFAKITMHSLSLWESGDSNGSVSLTDMFNNIKVFGTNDLSLERLIFLLCRGGWPGTVCQNTEDALLAPSNYIESLLNEDLLHVDNINRNPNRAMRILKSYARNISTLATNITIQKDTISKDETLDINTLSSYLNAFRRLYVIEDIPAWTPNIRGRTTIRNSPKKQLTDPSLAVAALALTPEKLIQDMETLGFLFESLCERDLRIYARYLGGSIFHYHDANNLEIDTILELKDGRYGAIEIKLSDKQITQATDNLLKFSKKMINDGTVPPAFLMILTGMSYSYTTNEGIYVVGIGCLKT
ncbi:MAG: DUF4143 domain-containing protein [Christensenellaceae bacterium]|jgi:predicted AAA+ superfamily ATPase|nr:DUF4143 domain-containing protein [Christensenellaceae bacterium]